MYKEPFSLKYRLVRRFFITILSPFIKKVNGVENLPANGPFIMAANHTSHLDWFCLQITVTRLINRHLHFISTTKYYNNPIFRFLVELGKGIWRDEKAAAKSLYVALQYLRHGEVVSIFPEGTRSFDGKLMKGKPGAASFALLAKAPVIPVGLINMNKILPRGAFIPRPARCEINIGKPLTLEKFYKDFDEAVDRHDLSKIAEIEEEAIRTIMQEIAKLSGQEYKY